jgi:hypothetical protein
VAESGQPGDEVRTDKTGAADYNYSLSRHLGPCNPEQVYSLRISPTEVKEVPPADVAVRVN